MSRKHPIIAITGSSGAGTSTVTETFQQIFARESIKAAIIHGDSFHRYDRAEMRAIHNEAIARGENPPSHFGPEANDFESLETLFENYGTDASGKVRSYVHDAEEERQFGCPPGTFTPWEDIEEGTDLLYYEGLHGAVKTDEVNVARHVDLCIGVVPIINLEWIQKIHRDRSARGYTTEAVTDMILRRMPDYVNYICPQFNNTDINFQRVPMVDTSNPFITRWIPTADESMTVIRFRNPRGIDFPYLAAMIPGSFMSRANSIVVPGGKTELAMQLIFTPMIWRLIDKSRKARGLPGLDSRDPA
ncbi:phosphoribulokinase [Flaviflexus huanghaiensis]|uniref:phosphoribulokinase n=1 Tax=Flaviflexus huanghaiensis TaxID=1111473 RepID=UPI0015FE541F|nr:phosphoribulokinase [Flaviflexus huanghaiensis]